MNPLLFALAYCPKDAAATQLLFEWINELGGCPGHHCLLTVDSKVDGPTRAFIKMAAENAFDHVQEIEFTEPPPPPVLRWPLWRFQANQMFLRTAQHIFDSCRGPFLWGEPDAIPMKAGWMDALSDSYYSQPMKFHGPIITLRGEIQAHMPTRHMAGVAIYPNSAVHYLAQFCGGEHTWDLGGGPTVVPKASKTRLIQHTYAPATATDENTGWTFTVKGGKLKAVGDDHFQIWEECVLFHRVKDGSLIKALRQLRQAENGNSSGNHQPPTSRVGLVDAERLFPLPAEPITVPHPVKRGPGRPRKVALT